MKIEGFREEMHETRRLMKRKMPDLALPEATTIAAKYELTLILAEKGGTLPNDISDEIFRRLRLIESTGAYQRAKPKRNGWLGG